MKLLIDGDGCPVIDISINIAKRFNKKAIIICDTSHDFGKYKIEKIIVSKGIDSADFIIVNKVDKGDIVITQDYGLAAIVISKGGYAISQNGLLYNNENIDQLLFTRHISKKARNSGIRIKGPKKRTRDDNVRFEKALIKLFEKVGY